MLVEWLQHILENYTKQKNGKIEVYELLESYKDYRPEWERIRNESCCRGSESGPLGYVPQSWALDLKRAVEFSLKAHGRKRLTIFLSGEKGSGKTQFVEWLAGELLMPVYYIDLKGVIITDPVLRDAVATHRLKHSLPVIFHFDEFQYTIGKWTELDRDVSPCGVTITGLQAVLEGISTPNNAVFIFTSSVRLPDLNSIGHEATKTEMFGFYRRIHVNRHIPPISLDVAVSFLSKYLLVYFPMLSRARIMEHPSYDSFLKGWARFSPESDVSFDAFKTYVEQCLRKYFMGSEVSFRGEDSSVLHTITSEAETDAFIGALFSDDVGRFRETYATGISTDI